MKNGVFSLHFVENAAIVIGVHSYSNSSLQWDTFWWLFHVFRFFFTALLGSRVCLYRYFIITNLLWHFIRSFNTWLDGWWYDRMCVRSKSPWLCPIVTNFAMHNIYFFLVFISFRPLSCVLCLPVCAGLMWSWGARPVPKSLHSIAMARSLKM